MALRLRKWTTRSFGGGPVDESRDARRAEAVVLSMLDSVSEKVDAVDCERNIAVADQVVGKAVEAREALLRHLRL